MNRTNKGRPQAVQPDTRRSSRVVMPHNGCAHAQLVLSRGATRTTIVADPTLGDSELLAAHFEGPPALVQIDSGRVIVQAQHASLAELARTALLWGRAETTLRLSAAVTWAIGIHGGASRVTINLGRLQLTELQISGGAAELSLDLPHPVGVVQIQFMGGVHNLLLRRPQGVPVHLSLSSGGSQLALDAQYIHAIAGPAQLVAGAASPTDHYVVRVAGGASQITIDTCEPGE